MRSLARIVGALVMVTALVSCGDSDKEPSDATASGQATDLADRAGVDAEAVVAAMCTGWTLEHPDQATINEYVHDLLRPLELVNSAEPPTYSTDEIDTLVATACDDAVDEPERFLQTVREGLGLSEAGLDALVVSACDRYRVQQERIAVGDWSGEDIAQFVRDLATGQGVELLELRAAIDGICGAS